MIIGPTLTLEELEEQILEARANVKRELASIKNEIREMQEEYSLITPLFFSSI